MTRLVPFALAALIVSSWAYAAATPLAVDPNSWAAVLQPILMNFVGVVLTLLLGLAARWLHAKTGIDIAANDRAVFQSAATNAAGLYIQTGDMGRAVQVLNDGAKDAIRRLAVDHADLPEKILAKAGVLTAPAGTPLAITDGAAPAAT